MNNPNRDPHRPLGGKHRPLGGKHHPLGDRHRPLFALACAAALTLLPQAARAQGFALEGAVIDSRNAQNLGVVSERGDINSLFRAQKAMTFGILRSAGISLDQLPADVRARIERFQTNNIEAFRAFSQGLDLKDQGKFVEAKEFFRRAAELDPNFGLASEQQRAMPEVNLGTGVQARAVVLAAAGAAVDRGRATYAVDASRAAAAMAAGLTVVVTNNPSSAEPAAVVDYTSNPAGSSSQFLPNLAVALTYPTVTPSGLLFNLATAAEYRAGDYAVAASNALDSAGNAARGFLAQRLGAGTTDTGSLNLPDGTTGGTTAGTTAYWGRWISTAGASAAVTVGGNTISAPTLGNVDYVYADATRQMPGTGLGNFTPAGGLLAQTSGNIQVNFLARTVTVQNLGFNIGEFAFTGLNGAASYASSSASGAFNGNYTSGNCTGCSAFTASNGAFGGNFVGANAAGMVFSTFLFTGPTTSVSGVHLFKQ